MRITEYLTVGGLEPTDDLSSISQWVPLTGSLVGTFYKGIPDVQISTPTQTIDSQEKAQVRRGRPRKVKVRQVNKDASSEQKSSSRKSSRRVNKGASSDQKSTSRNLSETTERKGEKRALQNGKDTGKTKKQCTEQQDSKPGIGSDLPTVAAISREIQAQTASAIQALEQTHNPLSTGNVPSDAAFSPTAPSIHQLLDTATLMRSFWQPLPAWGLAPSPGTALAPSLAMNTNPNLAMNTDPNLALNTNSLYTNGWPLASPGQAPGVPQAAPQAAFSPDVSAWSQGIQPGIGEPQSEWQELQQGLQNQANALNLLPPLPFPPFPPTVNVPPPPDPAGPSAGRPLDCRPPGREAETLDVEEADAGALLEVALGMQDATAEDCEQDVAEMTFPEPKLPQAGSAERVLHDLCDCMGDIFEDEKCAVAAGKPFQTNAELARLFLTIKRRYQVLKLPTQAKICQKLWCDIKQEWHVIQESKSLKLPSRAVFFSNTLRAYNHYSPLTGAQAQALYA